MREFLIFDAIFLSITAIAFSSIGAAQVGVGPYLAHHYRLHPGTSVLLNSLELTPGVVRTISREEVCGKTVTGQHLRNTTEKMKNEVYAEYAIDKHEPIVGVRPAPEPPLYEIDHLISLELGGADDVKNLWPQPYYQHPGAREKDLVENYLHRSVCSGKIELQEAQREIATDWYSLYLRIGKK